MGTVARASVRNTLTESLLVVFTLRRVELLEDIHDPQRPAQKMSATLTRIHPSNPTTSRGSSAHIATSPNGANLVYCHSRTVVIRPLSGTEGTVVYAKHAHPTTVARISPSGYYCASADVAGNVRVWDLAGNEQVLKLEVRALGGKITNLAWDSESKRIGVVGDGKDKFGHFFLIDSGSSCGEVTGHSKVTNAVAIRPVRPYRAATGGDDGHIVFYTGIPFKYQKTLIGHKGFVHTLTYAKDGLHFASGGSDGQLILYDGATGDVVHVLCEDGETSAHRGTLFSCDFSNDSKVLVSCGADATVKIWDIVSRRLRRRIDLSGSNLSAYSNKADDQLVGCAFLSDCESFVVLSLAGELSVIAAADGSISKKFLGSTKSIAVGGLVRHAESGLLAGSFDGRALLYSQDGGASIVPNASSSSAIVAVAADANAVWVASLDDTLRRIVRKKYDTFSTPTTGQPRSIASSSTATQQVLAVATSTGLDVIMGSVGKIHTAYPDGITAVAVSSDCKMIAIGLPDSKIYLFEVSSDGSLREIGKFESGRSAITALAFSTNNHLLAAGESNGKIVVYDIPGMKVRYNQWVFHTARINAIAFSPDGTHAVSASLDTNVYIWSTLRPMKSVAIKNAFAGGANGACWLDDESIACAGVDGTVKVWKVVRHV